MRKLINRFLPKILIIGTFVALPFVGPRLQHMLPGPEEESILPEEMEIVQGDEEAQSTIEEEIDIPFESEQSSEKELSSDIFLQEAIIQRVIDGDTIIVNTAEKEDMRIRFIGMDTPESVHPDEWKNTEEGIVASNFTKDLLPEGSTVYLEQDVSDTDQYGRYLRYIWITEELPAELTTDFIRGNMVNALLIDKGLAEVTTFEPDTKYVEVFESLE